VNVKVFAEASVSVDVAEAIPVFHRWIRYAVCDELLIDVADYRHVPGGPGVMLIGHEANYSLDCSLDRLGLLYNRKSIVDGNFQDKLLQAFWSAIAACRRLEEEEAFRGNLRFNAGDCEVILNDRLLAPNTEQTFVALKPELDRFFAGIFGSEGVKVERLGEPRERFRVGVRTQNPVHVRSLLEAL
jgi:hypothetical protein